MTLTEETILKGTKVNSMYQPRSVRGQATEADMNTYYTKEANTVSAVPAMKPNAMKVHDFGFVDMQSLPSVMVK